MIRVDRGAPPIDLTDAAPDATVAVRAALEADQKLEFDRKVYGSTAVKRGLVASHHGKCAFCESKVTHISAGDVEHYRPKAEVRQSATDPIERGYWWLAYTWSNLLFACEVCNRRHKARLFPLADPARRARTPDDDLAAEAPLFVDPSLDDPGEHITFHGADPCARSERGSATIDALGLDREPLRERRMTRLEHLRFLRDVVALAVDNDALGAVAERAHRHLRQAVAPTSEYAAMARAFLAG